MQGKRIRLKLESNLDVVEATEMMARQAALEKKISGDEIDQLGIAVRECVVNAVSHGNGYSRDKSVYFTVSTDATQLKIVIEDEGEGFDPAGVPDPTQEANLLQTSGRGLLLMRSFVDELTIGHTTEGGTEVVMVKNVPVGERKEKEEDVSLLSNVREVGGVTIIDFSGRITLGEGSEVLREAVRDVLSNGQKNILLNLGEVSYIDSSGLGTLVSAYTTGANQGAKVKLVNVQKKVGDLLQITKLYTVFESFDNESAAVGSYVP
jgi:anti-sigma B factor antagonist